MTSRQCRNCWSFLPFTPNGDDIGNGYCIAKCNHCEDDNIICLECSYVLHPKSHSDIVKRGQNPILYFTKNHILRAHRHRNNDTTAKNAKRIKLNTSAQNTINNEEDGNDKELSADIMFGSSILEDSFQEAVDELYDSMEDIPRNASSVSSVASSSDVSVEVYAEESKELSGAVVSIQPSSCSDDNTIASDGSSLPEPNTLDDSRFFSQLTIDASMSDDDYNVNAESMMYNDNIMDILTPKYNDINEEPAILLPTCTDPPNPEFPSEKDEIDRLYDQLVSIYDSRSDKEKRDGRRRKDFIKISQAALYFAQKSLVMTHDATDHLGGFRGLVSRSMFQNMELKHLMANRDESEVMFLYLKLMMDLKQQSKESFITYETKKAKLLGYDRSESSCNIPFPGSIAEVRAKILTGEKSILKNFPVSRVFNIGNHACVSLRETICMMAAHQGGFQWAWDGLKKEFNTEGLNGTKSVRKLIKRVRRELKKQGHNDKKIQETSIGYFYLWSDSFLKCFVKQKDNSVWIMTVTVSPPFQDTSTGRFTYVIAMGKSSEDHTGVVEHFHREVQELLKGFEVYDATTNSIRSVALGLLFIAADRPERAAILKYSQESHHGLFTGYAVKVSMDFFPACSQCYGAIAKESLRTNHALGPRDGVFRKFNSGCTRCLCWNVSTTDDPKMYCPAPDGYPNVMIPNRRVPKGRAPGIHFIGPVRLSSKWLKVACLYAYDARRLQLWSKDNVRKYLKTCNVKQELVEAIITKADMDRTLGTETEPEDLLPKIWTYYENVYAHCRVVDLPMHAWAHGMIPDNINAFHHVFANMKRFTEFINYANPILAVIASYSLSWCKVKQLPKAAWISENTMAYMRLFSYLYGMYFLNGKFNREVATTVLHMKRVMNSLQAAVSILMTDSEPNLHRVDIVYKLLLSSAHEFQKEYGSFNKDSAVDVRKANRQEDECILQRLTLVEISHLLSELNIPFVDTDTVVSMKKKLTDTRREVLIGKLNDRGITEVSPRATKSILRSQLFGLILEKEFPVGMNGKQTQTPGVHSSCHTNTTKKEDPYYMMKGAWVSLSQNYVEILDNFSNMLLLW